MKAIRVIMIGFIIFLVVRASMYALMNFRSISVLDSYEAAALVCIMAYLVIREIGE